MKKLVRKMFVLSVFLISCGVGPSAFALPIVNGIFSLVNDDGASTSYGTGELIATGSFTTADSVTDTISGFDAVPLIELIVNDRTPDLRFGNINYNTASTAGNYMVGSPLFALFDQATGDFVGLEGALADFTNTPWLTLTLTGSNANIGGASFGFQNLSAPNFESGFQIPEPNAIALLGIGFIAFGFARRKFPI